MNYTYELTNNVPIACDTAYNYSQSLNLVIALCVLSVGLFLIYTPLIVDHFKNNKLLKYSFKYIVFSIVFISLALLLNILFNT